MQAPPLKSNEQQRYEAQLNLPGLDNRRLELLLKSKIVIAGLGGIGCSAAQALATTGVGTISVMDHKKVIPPLLAVTSLFTPADIDKLSSEAVRDRLRRLNPEISVDCRSDRFDAHNAEEIAESCDLVIDGLSDWQDKLIASDVCMLMHKPLLHSGCLGFNFQLFTMMPGRSACLRCVFQLIGMDDLPPLSSSAIQFGPAASLAGALLASEAIKIITGLGSILADEVLQFDALKRQFYTTRGMTPRSDCPDCGRWATQA